MGVSWLKELKNINIIQFGSLTQKESKMVYTPYSSLPYIGRVLSSSSQEEKKQPLTSDKEKIVAELREYLGLEMPSDETLTLTDK